MKGSHRKMVPFFNSTPGTVFLCLEIEAGQLKHIGQSPV